MLLLLIYRFFFENMVTNISVSTFIIMFRPRKIDCRIFQFVFIKFRGAHRSTFLYLIHFCCGRMFFVDFAFSQDKSD